MSLGCWACGPSHHDTRIDFSESPPPSAAGDLVSVGRLDVTAPKAGEPLFKLVVKESGRDALGRRYGPIERGTNTYYAETDLEPWLRARLGELLINDSTSAIELAVSPRFRLSIHTARGTFVEQRTAMVRLDLAMLAKDQDFVVFDKTIKSSAVEDISLAWGLYPTQALVRDLMARSLATAIERLAEDPEFRAMGAAL